MEDGERKEREEKRGEKREERMGSGGEKSMEDESGRVQRKAEDWTQVGITRGQSLEKPAEEAEPHPATQHVFILKKLVLTDGFIHSYHMWTIFISICLMFFFLGKMYFLPPCLLIIIKHICNELIANDNWVAWTEYKQKAVIKSCFRQWLFFFHTVNREMQTSDWLITRNEIFYHFSSVRLMQIVEFAVNAVVLCHHNRSCLFVFLLTSRSNLGRCDTRNAGWCTCKILLVPHQ